MAKTAKNGPKQGQKLAKIGQKLAKKPQPGRRNWQKCQKMAKIGQIGPKNGQKMAKN